ncbi:MAG: glycosyltransferase family 4 protein [Pyrinomonadaceae bacterium]
MNVLGLSSYPIEAAATRCRMVQFVEPLAERKIDLTVSPFLDSRKFADFYTPGKFFRKAFGIGQPVFRRLAESFRVRKFDLLFVQREAMFFGPAFFENLYRKIGNLPLVLDLDDATYVGYESPTYGKLGSFLKFFGKTDNLIRQASVVTCGNRFIAEYVREKGTEAVIIPTVVDTEIFRPSEKTNKIPVIGWIGTHSTFPFVESIFPVLQRLAQKHEFVLKIVGAGREKVEIDGVKIENPNWNLEREVSDFRSLDIGLYPVKTSGSASSEWLLGKSGFKAIQYMAVGVPFVMSPVGVCAEIGEPDETHFAAESDEQWYKSLDKLLSDAKLREQMGASGRRHSLARYTVPAQADILAETFHGILRKRF